MQIYLEDNAMNIKTGLALVAIGAVLGATYNTTLYGPWAEDLVLLHNAYKACEKERWHIAEHKNIDPNRFNTCTVFFYYDVTESDNTGRYLHSTTADTSHMMWIGQSKIDADRKVRQEKHLRDLEAEDKRAAVPRN